MEESMTIIKRIKYQNQNSKFQTSSNDAYGKPFSNQKIQQVSNSTIHQFINPSSLHRIHINDHPDSFEAGFAFKPVDGFQDFMLLIFHAFALLQLDHDILDVQVFDL